MLRRAKLALFAVLGIALAISSIVYANATSVETGGTQALPRLRLTDTTIGGADIFLPTQTGVCWPAVTTPNTCDGFLSITGNRTGNILRLNAGQVEFGTSGQVYWNSSGFNAFAQSSRLDLGQSVAGLTTSIYNNTGATGTAVIVGSITADGTSGVGAVTLFDVRTGINGTPVSKFLVAGDGTAALAKGLTSSAATATAAFKTAVDGARICLNTSCSVYVSGDGFGGLAISGGLGANLSGNFSTTGGYSADGQVIGKSGVKIGTSGQLIEDSYSAIATIDFASTTNTTRDSAGITVLNAAVGDGCVVGPPVAAMVAGASFTCYVSGAGTVIVRLSAIGAGVDPASGDFTVRTLDPDVQPP